MQKETSRSSWETIAASETRKSSLSFVVILREPTYEVKSMRMNTERKRLSLESAISSAGKGFSLLVTFKSMYSRRGHPLAIAPRIFKTRK